MALASPLPARRKKTRPPAHRPTRSPQRHSLSGQDRRPVAAPAQKLSAVADRLSPFPPVEQQRPAGPAQPPPPRQSAAGGRQTRATHRRQSRQPDRARQRPRRPPSATMPPRKPRAASVSCWWTHWGCCWASAWSPPTARNEKGLAPYWPPSWPTIRNYSNCGWTAVSTARSSPPGCRHNIPP